MERFCHVFGHPHELVVRRGWGRALRHKVANGLCGVAQTEQEHCRGAPDEVFRGERLSFGSCVVTLANEKVRWRKSSRDGRGPRKAPNWRSSLP